MSFQLFFAILCLSALFVYNAGDKLGLYDETDDVVILNGTNFAGRLYGADRAWIVEFYNTWCGHCAKFAPKWKQLAKELKGIAHASVRKINRWQEMKLTVRTNKLISQPPLLSLHEASQAVDKAIHKIFFVGCAPAHQFRMGWRPVISIGALDCAERINMDLCRQYGVHAFPNFKLFKPYSDDTEPGEIWSVQDKKLLLKKMVDFVSNTIAFKVPLNWPKLEPLESVDHIWDHVQDKHTHVALVFEEENSYIGRQVILDTFQNSQLLVRRMLKGSVKKYGITEFPSMYLITRDGMFQRLGKNLKTREDFVKTLLELKRTEGFFNALLEVLPGQNNSYKDKKINRDKDVVAMDRKVMATNSEIKAAVYMKDLESTLHYSFRQEIALHREIEGERLSALKSFVQVLVKYFPGRHVVNDLLARISEWLADVEQLTGELWLNQVDNLQTLEAYIPEHVEWIGCQGSEPKYRGYPCGMWTLFHTLTVSVYAAERKGPRDVPPDILGVIENYMKYFFGCQICVEHFSKGASFIQPADRQPRNAVLWLWRGHNIANSRLQKDPTEDPKHLKVQFPPKQLCPECYTGDKFDEEKVFDFLLKFYGAKNIIKYKDESEEDYSDIDDNLDMQNGQNQKQLDWWELHQRKQGLERIHSLHLQKNQQKHKKLEAQRHNIRGIENKNLQFQGTRGVIRGWGFSNFDMGMCITFYLMCTLIIVLLYYHFIVRRKYKPFRIFSM